MEGTIIIADDDVSVRTVLSQAVSRAGCRVKSTGAISTLWRWIEEGEGDAVILDVVLPDGDALDILPALKKGSDDQTPWTPAINPAMGWAAALETLKEEGLENRWDRCKILAQGVSNLFLDLGF